MALRPPASRVLRHCRDVTPPGGPTPELSNVKLPTRLGPGTQCKIKLYPARTRRLIAMLT
ncbi:hypothetical protein BaRGS_00014193, partial [Batillaria attramentaria]